MRIALTFLSMVTLLGCSSEYGRPLPAAPDLPQPPPPPPLPGNNLGLLWGMVVDENGGCIGGATVTVVRGQAVGRSALQETPCAVWDYSGGFVFKDLIEGVEMKLRASAPGWADEEATVVPYGGALTAFIIAPSRLP